MDPPVAARLRGVHERVRAGPALDVLALTAALWFLAKFLRYALPPLFGPLRSAFGVGTADLGLAFTGLMAGYGATQFPAGALADRLGPTRVIVGGAVVAAGAALALAAAPTFPLLVAALCLLGVGTGAHKTVAITLLSATYPDHTGRALGTMDTVGELAGVLAPAAAVALLGVAVGWRALFVVAAGTGLALAAAFARRIGDPEPEDADTEPTADADAPPGYAAAVRAPAALGFALVAVLLAFVTNGVIAFLPLYLSEVAGLGLGRAGLVSAAFYAVAVVQPLSGEAADRAGRLRVVAGFLLLAALALAALVARPTVGAPALVALVAALGVGIHGTRPARDAHLVALLPEDRAGGALGAVRTAMLGGGAVAPALVGGLAAVGSLRLGFLSLVVGLAAALALVAGLALATAVDPGGDDPGGF